MKALDMILNALMLMTLSLAHADRETVEIPDSGLRNVIAKHLKKPADATITDITEADMAKLTYLHAGRRKITDLTGLGFAVNLTNLDLSETK